MMKNYRFLILVMLCFNFPFHHFSQKKDKIWIDGQGRSFFQEILN